MDKICNFLNDVYNFLNTSQAVGLSGFICGSLPFVTVQSLDRPTLLVMNTLYNGFMGSLQSYIISFVTMHEFKRLISIIFLMSAIRKKYVICTKQNKIENIDVNDKPKKQKVIKLLPLMKITITG